MSVNTNRCVAQHSIDPLSDRWATTPIENFDDRRSEPPDRAIARPDIVDKEVANLVRNGEPELVLWIGAIQEDDALSGVCHQAAV
jgi:hypothetical protein